MKDHECDHLFVYGTLMDRNLLKTVVNISPEFSRDAWILARMYNCGNFPMILPDDDRKVYGLIYRFDNLEELLPLIDSYERCNTEPLKDSFYIRKIVETDPSSDERTPAWAYFGNRSSKLCQTKCIDENLIDTGRWKSHK